MKQLTISVNGMDDFQIAVNPRVLGSARKRLAKFSIGAAIIIIVSAAAPLQAKAGGGESCGGCHGGCSKA